MADIRFVSKSDMLALAAEMKAKYTNQNAIASVKVGNDTFTAGSATAQFELAAGSNVEIGLANGVATISATDTTYSDVVAGGDSGLMSGADKSKLDGIAAGAEVNQNAFASVKVGASTISAAAKTDQFEIEGGSNVTVTASGSKVTIAAADATTYALTQDQTDGHKIIFTPSVGQATEITIPDDDTTYDEATTEDAGLMSASDKAKLDGIAAGAQVNVIEGLTVGGTALTLTNKVGALGSAAAATVASSVAADATLPTGAAVQTYVNSLDFQTSTDVESAINAKIATAMDWKGTVADMAALNAISSPKSGDVYHVTATGSEYAYNGSAWEELGVTFDATGYVQTTDLGGLTSAELAEIIAAL
jgi:hypothetical protein